MRPEPSLEQPSVDQDLAPGKPARARDLVWDELELHFGEVSDNTNAHAKRNKAVADLRRMGATPADIRGALRVWPRLFPGTTVTDVALATHYPQLSSSARPAANTASVAEELNLPEITEEERLANLERLRAMTGRAA